MSDGLIGRTLGHYEIRSLLGKGGMSTVYMAYQPSMDRMVALKVLPREFLHDDTFLIRFEREVKTIAKLEHLHILPVYDAGEDQGIPFIAMRYLPGGTLADLISEKLPQLNTVVRLVTQVAGALDHAHSRDIIHRDMKPSNVLLDSSRNAYLADFGIARIRQAVTVTTESHVLGTPAYVAPEMVRKGEPITPAVDIYALGIITYEMLTGEPPFYSAGDPMQTLTAHVLEPVPSVRDFDPNINPRIDAVIQRCLAKRPEDRYRSAGEYAQALVRAAESSYRTVQAGALPAERRPPTGPVPTYSPPPVVGPAATDWPESDYVEPEERSFPWGCMVGIGVVLALIAGAVVAASLMAGEEPVAALDFLNRQPTRTITPTVTTTPDPEQPPTITPAPTVAFDVEPLLPPPGGGDRLVFASNRDGDYEIYLIDVDGSNLTRLTDDSSFDFDPDWTPDGNRIVYVSSADGDPEIMVMDADGENREQLTDNTARDADPVVSPDGEWIAFTSDRDGDFEIYVMRIDGSGVRQLTINEDRDDLTPTWSPDGQRIAYYVKIGSDNDATDLYAVDVGGGSPTRLTNNDSLDQWPDWSPDGGRLVFTAAPIAGVSERSLATLDLTTGMVNFLLDPVARDDDPTWSPDGTRLAFDSDREASGDFDLYIFDLLSGQLRRLTSGQGSDVAPAWQPQR